MGVVVGAFASAPLFFMVQQNLWYMYERLPWMYFGFFPFVFLMIHAWRACCRWLGDAPVRLATVRAAGYVLVAFHAADQSYAVGTYRKTLLESAIPFVHSRPGSWAFHWHYQEIAEDWWAGRTPDRRRFFFVRPDWLKPDDRVLDLNQFRCNSSNYRAVWYWLVKQSVYWPDLGGESWAYAKRGPEFLEDWQACHEARMGRATDKVVRFLREKRVTLLVVDPGNKTTDGFLSDLRAKAGISLLAVAPGIYRLGPPLGKSTDD